MTLQRDPRVAALLPEAQATINRVARSFALAARFLPRDVRDDINLLYLALRRLDDLVDLEAPSGSAQRADAQQRLAAIRTWLSTGAVAEAGGDELAIFVDLQRRTPALPTDAIGAFLDGMESDLAGPVMESDADLDLYCYQVAGTVGRLMAALLGVSADTLNEADVPLVRFTFCGCVMIEIAADTVSVASPLVTVAVGVSSTTTAGNHPLTAVPPVPAAPDEITTRYLSPLFVA